MGGVVVANLAAVASRNGLPVPRAIMAVQPGKTTGVPDRVAVDLEDLSAIPASALLIAMSGADDRLAGESDALRIFQEATTVRPANRNFIRMHSDSHGQPPLVANHLAPAASDRSYGTGGSTERRGRRQRGAGRARGEEGGGIDALDYYGTWKLFDALCDAAFFGTNREYALGNTPQQRFMGRWSDGVAVRELEVIVVR
jgi:hypothetical protein